MNAPKKIIKQCPEDYGPKKPEILELAKKSDYFKFSDKVIITETGAYIDNIPKLQWRIGMDCTYCGCVTLILRAIGANVTYEQLMGLTASCYRTSMFYGWNPASNILDLTNYYLGTDIKDNALHYYGWECYQSEKSDTWDEAVMNSINAGIPVLMLGGRRAPEWSILLGYEKNDTGIKFFGRSYFDEDASEDECFTKNKYTLADKYSGEFGPVFFRKASGQTASTPLETLKKSLETCLSMFQPHDKFGYDAYKYMIESFKTNVFLTSWGSEGEIDSELSALSDARRAASIYLRDSARLLTGDNAEKLNKASSVYAELAEALNNISDHSDHYNLCVIKNDEKLREEIAQTLENCLILEKNAHALIGTVLSDWNI